MKHNVIRQITISLTPGDSIRLEAITEHHNKRELLEPDSHPVEDEEMATVLLHRAIFQAYTAAFGDQEAA